MNEIVKRNASGYPVAQPPLMQEPDPGRQTRILDFQPILRGIKRRTLLIVFVALLVIVPTAVVTFLSTPLYRSTALLQVRPDPVQVLPYRDVADSGGGGYYEAFLATQDQVLRGGTLASRVAERLKAEPDGSDLEKEADMVYGRFEVRRVPLSQLFRISYLAPRPETAARVVNLFAEEYEKLLLESRQLTREKAREYLQRELEILERRVEASEHSLAAYAKKKDIVPVAPDQAGLPQRKFSALDQNATEAEVEAMVATARLKTLQETKLDTFPERLMTPTIVGLGTRLVQLENDLGNLTSRFGDQWPAVIAKRDEIKLAQQQLNREKAAALAQAVQQAQLDLETARARLHITSGAMGEQKDLMNKYNTAIIQYNILRREAETNQKLYEGVLERLKQTSVQPTGEFGNVQVVEPGQPNSRVEQPRVVMNLAWAALLGLTLGVGIAILRDYWDDSLSTVEEMEEHTRLPTLGAVPTAKYLATWQTNGRSGRAQLPPPADGTLSISQTVTAHSALPPPDVAESVRAVCTSLLLSQSDRELRVIMVTSAVPSEGKSTVACELARTLADSGATTLLVETDLRQPSLAQAFGVDGQDGLSLFLSGHRPAVKVHQTDQPGLSLVIAGPKPPNPVALLNSERMRLFLKDMSSAFRFVILDTPPLLAVADARVLGAQADGVLLVVRARSTSRRLIQRAQMILQNSGVNPLGTVLNCAEDSSSMYYSRYYEHA
ncbi:MAG: polysaccharide biosynthesis tyrosine autokinase [Bryobacterales bacterium]|nr:polysaccharide biosynthesis tyrosine autokinase [Bryobacterales bacterium]